MTNLDPKLNLFVATPHQDFPARVVVIIRGLVGVLIAGGTAFGLLAELESVAAGASIGITLGLHFHLLWAH